MGALEQQATLIDSCSNTRTVIIAVDFYENAAAYFATVVTYNCKMVTRLTPGPNVMKLFTDVI